MDYQIPEDEMELAEWLLEEWDEGRGTSKSQLERLVWDDGASHGRRFDRFIRQTLGIETARSSKQTDRIADLEDQVRSLGGRPRGVSPQPWEEQLQHARQAALAALRVWNDPIATFRTGTFSLNLVTAWNSLAIAVLQKDETEWRVLDGDGNPTLIDGLAKTKETTDLVEEAFPGDEFRGLRENVGRWVALRNSVAHRHLPALDVLLIPLAQASLLNLENRLLDTFGEQFALSDALSVPLHLTGFRDPDVMKSVKALQRSLPLDVQALMSEISGGDEDLIRDPTYMLRVAFIPAVPPSGRSPDAVAYFARPDEVPEDLANALTEFVVVPKVFRPPRPHLIAQEVVGKVQERIPFRFTMPMHTEATRSLGIRARPGEGGPGKVDSRYCEYVSSVKRHLYNQDWVDRLVEELAAPDSFETVTGRPAKPHEPEADG